VTFELEVLFALVVMQKMQTKSPLYCDLLIKFAVLFFFFGNFSVVGRYCHFIDRSPFLAMAICVLY